MSNPRTLRQIFLALTFSAVCLAQQTGTIQGNLVDAAGATVPNAKVTAIDEARQNVARETTTDRGGTFYLRNLLPGSYTVKVEAPGFKALDRTELKLDANQIMNVGALTMQIGQTSESITVAAEVPLVETSTSQKSFVISSRQVTELSLNGRDFQSLMRTLPGVASNSGSDFRMAFNNTDQFNVNGLRGSMNNVYLDGSINTDVGANDGQYTQVSLDAVGEFKVQTSTFNAEYGRNPGVLININTKGGSSTFHGTLYEFLRNDYFDARQPFDTTGKPPKIRFNQFGGNLGGPIIIPNFSAGDDKKLFFFVNLEKTLGSRPLGGNFVDIPHGDLLNGDLSRLLRPGNITGSTFQNGQIFRPGTVVRDGSNRIIGGDPYPNNIIPKSEWSRNAPAFIKILAAADRSQAAPHPTNPEQVRYPFQETYKLNKFGKVARIDYNISSNANFFFRWADDSQREDEDLGIFNNSPYPIHPQYRKKPGASWSWNLVNVLSPTTTNEFIFTYNHLTQVVDLNDDVNLDVFDKTKAGFTFQDLYPNTNQQNKFPRFNCGVGSCGFSGFAAPWLSEGKTFAITDNFTWTRNAHTFKFGGLWNRNDNKQQPNGPDSPNFNFGSSPDNPLDTGSQFANMLLGNYTSVQQTNGVFYSDYRFYGYEFYGQDSWRVSKNFTLEMGLRWSFYGPTYTLGEFLAPYFDPGLYDPSKAVTLDTQNPSALLRGRILPGGDPINGIVMEGAPGVPKGFSKHRYNNWSPRLGFAWDPFGDGKTSIRGGGGIFYERIRQNNTNFGVQGNPPLTYNPTVSAGNIDNVSPALVASGSRFPVSLVAWDKEGQIPTITSWSLGIQRELGGRTSLDVAYVGNIGRHLMYRRDINTLPLGTTTTPGVTASVNGINNALRPYKGYTGITFNEFGASSNYHSLQTRVSRRFAQNLTANVNYTWSKAMGDTDDDNATIGYAYDRRREYAPLGFDRTHVLTVDYVYELPRFDSENPFLKYVANGWQISGITRMWSGRPFTITSNADPGTLGGGVRADYIGGDVKLDEPTRENYFNIFAFARPQQGSLGNLGRNTLRGPGIHNWDVSLFKNTRIGEKVNVQLRFETFNVFNHTQWDGLNTSINAPNPGAVLTTATRGQAGTVTSTRDPRNIQLGMKLLF
ncbi:MAG TPA: carboxypeptidase regulatory-like domain-containing protein [Bryobacteraceae bacterium]|nr:carboxypeptidase regulatory-like domain-containing protein [Bryobacteraceae bacterium]